MIGGAGVAALPLIAVVGGITRTSEQPTDLTFSMNTNWLFGGQYRSGSENSFFDDSNFASVTLPHTVTSLSWQNWDYLAWQQVWIYRRHFDGAHLLDPHSPGNRILVDFDGVMVNASVAINDQVVSTHQGGYLPFSAELTGKVTSGDNLLAVIVDSRCLPVPPVGVGRGPASVDFFQPGGIYREVRLRVLPKVFLSDLFAQPADVLSSQPRVDVECTMDSAAPTQTTGTLLVELLDGPTQIAAQTTTVKVTSPGISTAKLSLTGLGQVSLWSPDSPKLYTVQATVNFPGLGSHVLTRRIGFREASFRPEGFFLNGKRLPLFGLNRHQLFPYAGMAMPARVQRKDAEILKNEFNCNMVRCSHYPQSPDFLDACDELGLLVWEEAPGWHNVSTSPAWQDLVVQNVRDMVTRDRSRPSVVIWGTRLNETPDFPGLWAATRQAAKELDSSRPSSGAMAFHQHVAWNEDVFAYNDYGTEPKTGNIELKPPFAGLPYLVTEAVGLEAVRPQHFAWTDPPAWLARQAALHGQAQSQARSNPGYAGLLAWAGFDYASLLGQGPANIKWAGVADGFRVPKPGAAIYQTQGDPAVRPLIIPVFFWEAGGAVRGRVPDRDDRQQLRPTRGLRRRHARRQRAARLRVSAVQRPDPPALPGPPPQAHPGRHPRAARRGLRRRPAGGPPPDVSQPGRRRPRHGGRRRDHHGRRLRRDQGGVSRHRRLWQPAQVRQRRRHADPVRPGHADGRQPVRVRPVRRARRGVDPLAGGPAGGHHADREPSAARPGRGAGQVRAGESGERAVTRRPWHVFRARSPARSAPVVASPKLARMRRTLSVSVSELNPGEFTARLDQLIAVYAAAMRPPAELLTGRRSIMAGHTVNPGFRALAVIDDGTGEAVGFGYGFHGAAGQWWHDTVSRALAASRGAAAARPGWRTRSRSPNCTSRPTTRAAA